MVTDMYLYQLIKGDKSCDVTFHHPFCQLYDDDDNDDDESNL